jgi:hypothetical protein
VSKIWFVSGANSARDEEVPGCLAGQFILMRTHLLRFNAPMALMRSAKAAELLDYVISLGLFGFWLGQGNFFVRSRVLALLCLFGILTVSLSVLYILRVNLFCN